MGRGEVEASLFGFVLSFTQCVLIFLQSHLAVWALQCPFGSHEVLVFVGHVGDRQWPAFRPLGGLIGPKGCLNQEDLGLRHLHLAPWWVCARDEHENQSPSLQHSPPRPPSPPSRHVSPVRCPAMSLQSPTTAPALTLGGRAGSAGARGRYLLGGMAPARSSFYSITLCELKITGSWVLGVQANQLPGLQRDCLAPASQESQNGTGPAY